MSKNYKFHNPEGLYFVSFTVINWLDIFAHQPEGYVKPTVTSSGVEMNYVYQYKDHLGNIRLSYQDKNNDGVITASTEIVEENNYYPFGLKHKGYNSNVITEHKYKYNGKEFEEGLGLNLYEMDVRSYDPAIARFTSVDPVTHFSNSTYSAFDNNPVLIADPSGADGQISNANWAPWNGYVGTVQIGSDFSGAGEKQEDKDKPNKKNKNVEQKVEDFKNVDVHLDEVELTYKNNDSYKKAIKEIVGNIYSNQDYYYGDNYYYFEEGKTYNITIIDKIFIDILGSSYSNSTISYNNEKIGTSLGYSLGFGVGLDAGAFIKYTTHKITFYQTMTGKTLLDVFNQTGLINNNGFGVGLLTNRIRGFDSRAHMNSLWEGRQTGSGFALSIFSGNSYVPNYIKLKN